MKINKILLMASIAINLTIIQINSSNLNLKSQTSAIKLLSGTNFIIENKITDYPGTLITESGATIEGENITFNNGIIEDCGNKIFLSGQFTPTSTNKIILNGNKNAYFNKGTINQSIEISSLNNKIEGSLFNSNNIILQDANTSVSCAIINELPCNFELNNGSLYLTQNLLFSDKKKIIGPGKITFNNYRLAFGAENIAFDKSLYFDNASDIELNANITINDTWTFSGNNCVLCAQGNGIFLGSSGAIVVEAGSSLTIKDATLKNISDSKLRCSTNNGKIIFQNVNLILSNNYTFSSGQFEVLGELEINESYTFAYQSPIPSLIRHDSRLILNNTTFSYAPNAANQNLLTLAGDSSSLVLNNATLHTTTTHLQLAKGNLLISENSYLSSDGTGQILLGNNNSSDDIYCNFLNNATLNLIKGKLVYQNINNSAWKMNSFDAALNIYSNTTLNLQQDLNVQEGSTNFYLNFTLETQPNKYLFGATSELNEYK